MNALDTLRTVLAAAEPGRESALDVKYGNLVDLHKAAYNEVLERAGWTTVASGRPVAIAIRRRNVIAITPKSGKHTLEIEPSEYAGDVIMYNVDSTHLSYDVPRKYQMTSGTPRRYLQAMVAFACERLPQQTHAAVEPAPTGVNPNQALTDLTTEVVRRSEIDFKIGDVEFKLRCAARNLPELHVTCPRWQAQGFYFIDYRLIQLRSARQGTVPKLWRVVDDHGSVDIVSGDIHRMVDSWKDLLRNAAKLAIKHGEAEFKRFLKMKKQTEKLQAKAAAEPHAPVRWTMLTLGKALSEENLANVHAAIPGYTVDYETDFDDGTHSAAITKDGEVETYGNIQFFPGYGDLKRGIRRQPPELGVYDVDGVNAHEFNVAAIERTLAAAHGDAVTVYTKLLRAILPQAVAALAKHYGDKA